MKVITAALRELIAAGVGGEGLVSAIGRIEDALVGRSSGAERTARWRDGRRHGDVTASPTEAEPIPSKVPPITPLNTPQDSEPNGSAAGAALAYEVDIVGEDPKARLFRLGKTVLVSFGVVEKRTGSLIGQWLKAKNDPAGLLAAIQFARDQNVAEPVAYISTLVSGKGNKNGQFGALATAADDLIARAEKRELENAAFTIDVTPGRG